MADVIPHEVEDRLRDDLTASVTALLATNRYLVLGTIDDGGGPWVTPVFFGADGVHTLFWVSSPTSRHSRNIATRPAVGGTVFDSTVAVGAGSAVYVVGTAGVVPRSETDRALDALNRRLDDRHALSAADVDPTGDLVLYRAEIAEHFVLVRGGDPRIEDSTDRSVRVRIERPDA